MSLSKSNGLDVTYLLCKSALKCECNGGVSDKKVVVRIDIGTASHSPNRVLDSFTGI